MAQITREQLVQLILVEHLTEAEAAEKLGVHKNTVARAKKQFEINQADWWKFQTIRCECCGTELDPKVELSMQARKTLIAKKHPICLHCKVSNRKQYNKDKQAEWRDTHREEYNQYMKNWRMEHKAEWKAIKEKSRRKAQGEA